MMIASRSGDSAAPSRAAVLRRFLGILLMTFAALVGVGSGACAAEPDSTVESRIQAAIPEIEAYIADGMKAFDVPVRLALDQPTTPQRGRPRKHVLADGKIAPLHQWLAMR